MDNPERVTYFGATDSRGKYIPFGIKTKDRDKHMYIVGKTGMGKSTILENMAIQDIRNGEGLAFIDPHGSTVERLLSYIPEHRIKDVVYFAPFDLEHPVAFNVMEDVGYDKRHLVVSGLMATFKKIWEDAWSARMEYILTNTLLALLEYPGATLLGVNRMYTDKDYRKKVVDNVKDPVVKDFWTKEFANYGDRYTQEATPAIQNKVGQFTGNPLIRNIIGQSKSSFDIRTMMDERKILIMNLSKGLVGETNMRLLGSMLTTRIFLGAMSRAGTPVNELATLPNFYFYVDEFQNFANETFAEILSEARKYKLNLIIANQYIEQMEDEVRDAVFGNVGTTAVFRVGPFDAEVLETIFLPKFTKEDIVTLDKFQIYLSLMIDGVGSAPFSAVTIPRIEPPRVSYADRVIESSREQFTVPRAQIEDAIMKEFAESLAAEAPLDARMKRRPVSPQKNGQEFRRDDRQNHMRSAQDFRPREQEDQLRDRPEKFQRNQSLPSSTAAPVRPRENGRSKEQDVRPAVEYMPLPQKTADDLKSILRAMTEKNNTDTGKKKDNQKQSLRGALAGVLIKHPPAPRQEPEATRPAEEVAVPNTTVSVEDTATKPFEVPEEKLRKVLKGES